MTKRQIVLLAGDKMPDGYKSCGYKNCFEEQCKGNCTFPEPISPMKETEQTLLDQIKDQVARFLYNASWNSIGPLRRAHCWPQVHSKHVEQLELIIHGITEGAEEWKSKCADLERDKAKMFTRSQVQASCEATPVSAPSESQEELLAEILGNWQDFITDPDNNNIDFSSAKQQFMKAELEKFTIIETDNQCSYDQVRSEYLNHRGRIWTKEEEVLKWIIENYTLITRNP